MGKKIKILLQGLRNIIQGHWKNGAWCNFFFWRRKVLSGYTKYSVVTPAYNVELYLDDYFNSLVSQKLDFVNNIQLILVDDGSTDGTAKKIAQWQKKFPDNIVYLYQDNQGPNFARNAGIRFVKKPWVTFIDSDDFVHTDYFWHVDRLLRDYDHFDIKMLSCKEMVFSEKRSKYKDIRPFRVFHLQDPTLLPHNDLQDYMHFSLSSAFFPLKELKRQNFTLTLGQGWPCFEDGHSVLRYLKETQQGHVLFCRSPVYYYRKRADKSSQIDSSTKKKSYYLDVLRDGYLDVLKQYQDKFGFVPAFVQRSCLYEMSWRIKSVQSMGRKIPTLSNGEQQEFLSLCDRIFSYIDRETILSFPVEMSGFSSKFKLGTVYCFKGEQVLSKVAFCDKYDRFKNLFRVSYFSTDPEVDCVVTANGIPLQVTYSKVIRHTFLLRAFVYEVQCWFPCPTTAKEIAIAVAGEKALLGLGGKQKNSFSAVEIKEALGVTAPVSCQESHWVLIDRNDQADDNAEHFYRYLAKSHPERKIYFGLKKKSHDWCRLDIEGVNLLEYSSRKYRKKLEDSSLIISSHLDEDLRKEARGKPFVFLQHGVTQNDLSQWINSRKIDLFITSNKDEYNSRVMTRTEVFLYTF